MTRRATKKTFFLFSLIIIEGYVVLATELLAIRQLVPFVGSGIEVVSIIISAILLPLAVGYHNGGMRVSREFEKLRKEGRKTISIRKILLRNLLTSLLILMFGLSYAVLEIFFAFIRIAGIENRVLQTSLYSLVFLVVPTFLLAQTIPLLSNYFSKIKLSEITGKMLFFSTSGSFMGSIFSTLVLMMAIGVHNTVNFTMALIVLMVLLVTKSWMMFDNALALILLGVLLVINGNGAMKSFNVVSDSAYSIISVFKLKDKDGILMSINHSSASRYSSSPDNRFAYIRFTEKHFIETREAQNPMKVLVLGAGGFTLGWDDVRNHYTFVDIDPVLQPVAEKYLLPSTLSSNKTVVTTSARAFLINTDKSYDFIFIDLFTNQNTIPMESITREFLVEVKKHLNPQGIIVVNMVGSANYNDLFSVRYYNTFRSVFSVFDRQIIGEFSGWSRSSSFVNTLYIYHNNELVNDSHIYVDDKNTYSIDH